MEHIKRIGLSCRAKIEATDLIDDYTLLVLSPETTPQGREATKTSVLFSQLATDVNRFRNPKEWGGKFSEVLSHIGWTMSAFNMETIHINGPTVFLNTIVEAIQRSSTTPHSAVKEALKTLTTKKPVRFFNEAVSGNRATILIVTTSKKGDDTNMTYCMFSLEAVAGVTLGDNFLINEWRPQQIANVQIGITNTTLNREQYETVRQTLRDKLLDALLPYQQL